MIKPFVVLVEHGATRAPIVAQAARDARASTARSRPPAWRKDGHALVEAFPTADGSRRRSGRRSTRVERPRSTGTDATLGGVAPEDRDFVHAVYGNFPYVLLFVILLTYVLLARAFRSLVLPLKAVILNLVSLGAAYGIIVFIFQQGHGSEAIWGVHGDPVDHPVDPADDLRVPVRALDGLRGLHADAHARGLRRDRRHAKAVALGLARTGKLVTSAALVLMFAFFVLSTSPGTDIKQFGIGLAAGIIFDATVIRALLVPAIMMLIGRWNWWLPAWAARPLRTQASEPVRGTRAGYRVRLERQRPGGVLRQVDQRLDREERADRDGEARHDRGLQQCVARRRAADRRQLQILACGA